MRHVIDFTDNEIDRAVADIAAIKSNMLAASNPPLSVLPTWMNIPAGATPILMDKLAASTIILTNQKIPTGANWVAGDQTGNALSHFDGDILINEIWDAKGKLIGSRTFPTNSGRWDILKPYYGKTIRLIYEANHDLLGSVYGSGGFSTRGIEIKPDSTKTASVQVNVELLGGKMRYWLGGWDGVKRLDNAPEIPVGEWHYVGLDVFLGISGQATLYYKDMVLKSNIQTTLDGGWTGLAWCNYTDSAPDAAHYLSRFRNRRAYLLP